MQLWACKDVLKMNYDYLKANNQQSFSLCTYTFYFILFFSVRTECWQTTLEAGFVASSNHKPPYAKKNKINKHILCIVSFQISVHIFISCLEPPNVF